MIPRCYNRPPFTGYWARNGTRGTKVVYRWIDFVFAQRCASWDSPDPADLVPLREKWDCNGCCWQPNISVV